MRGDQLARQWRVLLMSLYFCRDILRIFKDTVFYESLDEVFRKVRSTLPPESLSYLKRIEQTFHVGFKPFKDYSRFKEIIRQINEAVLKCRAVEMRYYSMSSKLKTVGRYLFGESMREMKMHRALADARLAAMIWLEMEKI